MSNRNSDSLAPASSPAVADSLPEEAGAAAAANSSGAQVASGLLPRSSVELAEASAATDHVLSHPRLSRNDDGQVMSKEEQAIETLEKGYHLALGRIEGALASQNGPDSRETIDKLVQTATKVHAFLAAKMERSHIVGKALPPPVDEFLSGRVPWDAWQPEDLSARGSILPEAPISNKAPAVVVEDEEDEANDHKVLQQAAASAGPVASNGSNSGSSSNTSGMSLAQRLKQQRMQAATNGANASAAPKQQQHQQQQQPAAPASSAPVVTAAPSLQYAAQPSISPSAPAVSQVMSFHTVDKVARENHDVRNDTQTNPGVLVRQSKSRIFFSTLMSRLTGYGSAAAAPVAPAAAAGASTAGPAPIGGQADARHMGHKGRRNFLRRHCGAA
jgi:hypothetical protein